MEITENHVLRDQAIEAGDSKRASQLSAMIAIEDLAVLADIQAAVTAANGRRRDRLIEAPEIKRACQEAIAGGPGDCIVVCPGNVGSSYAYKAFQTALAVTFYRGCLYWAVAEIGANKGQSYYTWFGGRADKSDRDNAKALRKNKSTKRINLKGTK